VTTRTERGTPRPSPSSASYTGRVWNREKEPHTLKSKEDYLMSYRTTKTLGIIRVDEKHWVDSITPQRVKVGNITITLPSLKKNCRYSYGTGTDFSIFVRWHSGMSKGCPGPSTSTGPSTEAQASVEFSEHIRRILVCLIGHVNKTDEDQQTLMLTLKKLEDAGPRSIKQRIYFIFFEGSFIKYLQIFFKKSSILFHVFF